MRTWGSSEPTATCYGRCFLNCEKKSEVKMTATAQAIDLTIFAADVDNALAEGVPCIIATSDDDGKPDLALKGSVMVYDADHLAFLERSHGASIENLGRHPDVAILYRNSQKRISSRRF